MSQKAAIIIPARYGSTRFPGKPLAMLSGKCVIDHVVARAEEAAEGHKDVTVYVATDDKRIKDHCTAQGHNVLMTPESCRTGSDRVLAAADALESRPDILINLQGDNPFAAKEAIGVVLDALISDTSVQVATPVVKLTWDTLDTLREQKKTTPLSGTTAVIGTDDYALWFSKNIIPAIRKESDKRAAGEDCPVYRHIGLYGYRYEALKNFTQWQESYYERLEGLEQLRFLENGVRIKCRAIDPQGVPPIAGIDSPEDLARAQAFLDGKG